MFAWRDSLLRLLCGSLFVRALGAAAALLLQLALARGLGAGGVGAFLLGATLMSAGAILVRRGLDAALLRDAGTAYSEGDLVRFAQLFAGAQRNVLERALLLTMTLGILATATVLLCDPNVDAVFLAAMIVALVPVSLSQLCAAGLKAMDRPARAAMIEFATLPVGTLIALMLCAGDISLPDVGLAYLAAAGLAMWLAMRMLGMLARPRRVEARCPSARIDLVGIDLLNLLLGMGTIPLVALVLDQTELGVFAMAQRISAQPAMLAVLIGGILAPRIAAAAARRDDAGIRGLSRMGSAMMTLLGLPLLLPMCLLAEPIGLWLGDDFDQLHLALPALALAQLVNLLTGPAGYVLVMTGRESELVRILFGAILAGIPATIAAGHAAGLAGAAIAVAVTQTLYQLLAFATAKRPLRPRCEGALILATTPS